MLSSQPETVDDDSEDDDVSSIQEPQPNDPSWIGSRRNSAVLEHSHRPQIAPDQHGFLHPATAAAAFGQIAAQWHQLQQSVQWIPHFQLPALPPMPNFEHYQANPMVRRISSLVPHGGQDRNEEQTPGQEKLAPTGTTTASNWRDLFSASPQPPPAYDEIYPSQKEDLPKDLKEESEARAQAENVLDQKCAAIFDTTTTTGESSSTTTNAITTEPVDTRLEVRIGRRALSKEEQQRVRSVHQQKRKPIYKDWHLWFIWIPLFLLFIFRRPVLNFVSNSWDNISLLQQQSTGLIVEEL